MSRYIDADEFKRKYLCCGFIEDMKEEEFDKFPTADVQEVRHGHWDTINSKVTQCSVCGVSRDIRTQVGWNFCPVCGAKMDEEEQK